MVDHNPPTEREAQSDSGTEPTAVLVTAQDGTKVGIAPLGTRCTNYRPGHTIHAIHARHAGLSTDWVPARVLAVDGNYIEFVTESGTWRRWNHNAAQLGKIAEVPDLLPDAEAEWCKRYWLLRVEVDGVGYLLSLAESGDNPCSFRWRSE